MIASRFWLGLLGLSLSAAALVAYLAVSMHDRLGVRLAAEGLSADSRVVSWYLKNSAREAAAQLIRFAGNDSVARSLSGTSRAEHAEDIDAGTRRQLKGTLAKIAQELPKDEAFDAVFAVSQSGEVVASFGFDQASDPEFELGGYPVVADALHGYVRDDTLLLDRIYRVVARPVEFELGQLPAGAIVGLRVVDDRFAAELSEKTGAAVAFYAAGRRVALGAPATFDRSGLDQIVTDLPSLEKDTDYRDKGRTNVHPFADGLAVVYARLPGEAWRLGIGYAVARQAPRVLGIGGVLKQADAKDKEAVSSLLLLGIAVFSIGIGMGLIFVEYTMPLGAFKRQVKVLSGGSISQLTVERMRGPFRQLSLDLNLALDRVPRSSVGEDGAIAVGFDQVFGDAAPASTPMTAFGVPGSMPPGSFAGVPASSAVGAPQYGHVTAAVGGFDFASSGSAALASARGAIPPRRTTRSGGEAFPMTAGAAAVAFPPALPEPEFSPSPPRVAALDMRNAATAQPAAEPSAANGDGDHEPEWMQVYHDFVRLKQDCGEAVEGFTFERFTQTLRKNRDTLMREHGVQRVHFSAYVKQGRAALKAKPVRD
ncbi:MAG: MXAN_5187 family protein [Deltaproteobacteria bacterium]